MNKLRILLADDHKIVREGLKLLVDAQPDMEVVGQAGNGKEACQKAISLKPDLVVMDLSMPELNGLQAAELLQKQCPEIKVLALTVHEDEGYLRELLKAKAAGYVLKRSAGEELIKSIRKVCSGGVSFDPTLAGKALMSQTGKSLKGEPRASELSAREKKVLSLVAWGYSNKEIAGELGISVKTVETYKLRLSEKLGLHSRADIVRYALRRGWLKEA